MSDKRIIPEIRPAKELEKEIESLKKDIERLADELEYKYEQIFYLTVEKDLGIKIVPLKEGGAIIDGQPLTEEEFEMWIDNIVDEYQLNVEEQKRTVKVPVEFDA